MIAGERRHLAKMPWHCFEILWRRRRQGRVSRETFMTLLYGDRNDPPYDRTLNVHLAHLRRALRGVATMPVIYGHGWHLVEGWAAADDEKIAAQRLCGRQRLQIDRLRARGMAMLIAQRAAHGL
jgi:DNA-binding winged helix-turn-helix (wHTH) protein